MYFQCKLKKEIDFFVAATSDLQNIILTDRQAVHLICLEVWSRNVEENIMRLL